MSLAGRERGRRGVVLLVVLFFALLLTSSVATFLRRSTVDALIARNVDARGEADALARGGVLLSCALLAEDRLQELAGTAPVGDNYLDVWARVSDQPAGDAERHHAAAPDRGRRGAPEPECPVRDGRSRRPGRPARRRPEFLTQLLAKVIDELPVPRRGRSATSRRSWPRT